MDRIGIIGALDEEIELYLAELDETSKETASGFSFFTGKLSGKNVVVVKCGAGKVNAGICAQLLINKFNVSSIIFTGVAGALNPELELNDLVISRDSVQSDLDARELGFEKGQIPFTNLRFFKASPELKELALASSKSLGLKAIEGRMLTGDQFITKAETTQELRKEFDGDCVDMESAALAHVCALNNIPHLIIRSISDKADHSASVNFNEFVKDASKNSFKLVIDLISKIPQKQFDSKELIKSKIRTVPNFPKKGIMFRDITTLFKDKGGFNHMIDLFVERYRNKSIDLVTGIESRGFITGAVLANRLGVGFVVIRKPNKLPAETISEEYALEYGVDKIEIHKDAIEKGDNVLLVDDLIATGGTALAGCKLIEKLGGKVVECSFIVDLKDLGGKQKLEKAGFKVFNLVEFEGD